MKKKKKMHTGPVSYLDVLEKTLMRCPLVVASPKSTSDFCAFWACLRPNEIDDVVAYVLTTIPYHTIPGLR